MAQSSAAETDAAADRALYYAPEIAFNRPVPPVPATVFSRERAQAFDPAAATGFVALDQREALGCPWPATTPALLARYIVIRPRDSFPHSLQSTGQIYYVIRGDGVTACAGERFAWGRDDAFCLPGGREVELSSDQGAILMVFSNEPELAYLRANAGDLAADAIAPTHFLASEIDSRLREVHGRNGEQLAAGKSVVLLTRLMAERRVTTPTMLAAINSLEAGGDQRPHKHSSAALTLSIQGDGVYSMVAGERVNWEPDTLIVTPPYAEHSHHNHGTGMMRSFVVQDTGLHTELRTISFNWTD